MASRAFRSSGLSICLRCQLRTSGLLQSRQVLTLRKLPLAKLLPVTYRRWASAGLPTPPEHVPPVAAPSVSPDVSPPAQKQITVLNDEGSEKEGKSTGSEYVPPVTAPPLSSEVPPPAQITVLKDKTPKKEGTSIPTGSELADTAPKKKRPGLPQLENRNLLILEMPTRRRKIRLLPPTEVAEEEVLTLTDNILTFEQKADAYELAIDFLRPLRSEPVYSERPRKSPLDPTKVIVSMARYKQIEEKLETQFNRPQIYSYVNTIFEGEKRPSVMKSMLKRDLISVILKKLWKVEISEEIHEREDLIVEKRLQMSKEDVFFLVVQNGRTLRNLVQEHNARMTINFRESWLAIEATMIKIEEVEKRISEYLQQKIHDDVDLTMLDRLASFDKTCIPIISSLTGTYINAHGDNIYRVSTIGPDITPLEDARRLLFDSHELAFRTAHSLAVDSTFSPSAESSESLRGSLYRVAENKSLSWMMRGKDWSRWRSIKTKTPNLQPEISPAQQKIAALIKHFAPSPDRKNSQAMDPEEKLNSRLAELDKVSGIEKVQTMLDMPVTNNERQYSELLPPPEYTATLGFVLHNSTMRPLKPNTLAEVLEENADRIFCENIPGLTYLVANHSLLNDDKPSLQEKLFASPFNKNASDFILDPETGEATSIEVPQQHKAPVPVVEDVDPNKYAMLIRFSPSPWEHRDDYETYPPVEMEVEVDPKTGEVSNPRVVAVHSDSVADLMLPARECDVRFRRRVVVPLYTDSSGKQTSISSNADTSKAKENAVGDGNGRNLDTVLSAENTAENTSINDELMDQAAIDNKLTDMAVADNKLTDVTVTDNKLVDIESVLTTEEMESMEANPGGEESKEFTNPANKLTDEPNIEESTETTNSINSHLPDQSSTILAYLAASRLNPTVYDRLQPATELTLQIPNYLCSSPSPLYSNTEETESEFGVEPELTTATNPTDTIPVKYIFTTMSYLTTTPLRREKYHLNKKVIEGGLSGGKKIVVEMEFKKIDQVSSTKAKTEEGDNSVKWDLWTDSVLRLVGQLGIALGRGREMFVWRR